MLQSQTWDEIVGKTALYKYSTLHHVEYEDVMNAELLQNDANNVIIIDKAKSPNMLCFATNEIEKTLREIDSYDGELRVNFVPHDFADLFKNHGFTEWAEYADFFNEDIRAVAENIATSEPVFLRISECETVSEMSKKCEKQSRGFTGESAEWFADWMKENDVIVVKDSGEIIGFCCVSIYANGTILWIREIAVLPQYQGKGFGKMLMAQAIQYGVDRDAHRGFLAADILNEIAIGLYNSYGFYKKNAESELQMIRTAAPAETIPD